MKTTYFKLVVVQTSDILNNTLLQNKQRKLVNGNKQKLKKRKKKQAKSSTSMKTAVSMLNFWQKHIETQVHLWVHIIYLLTSKYMGSLLVE